jgi:MoxR-like ATPase
MPLPEAARHCERVLNQVGRAVVGKQGQLSLILAGLLAGGHVLIEDNPGLAKTLAARSFAQALGLVFRRVQFTPDLLPSDITGSFIYDQSKNEFAFRSGPLFAGLVLADEINRTPPKTQAALLEAMQEGQATVEGRTFELPKPFHVIATANPIEYEGTYPLPEAQLDRFLIRVAFGYPSKEEEWQVLRRRMERRTETITVDQVLDAEQLLAIQQVVETVEVSESVGRYCVDLVDATRFHKQLLIGSSPRGALALLLVARAYALIHHRDYVTPEDVKAVAAPALAHRITLRPEMWVRNLSPVDVIENVLKSVQAPDADRTGYSAVGRR